MHLYPFLAPGGLYGGTFVRDELMTMPRCTVLNVHYYNSA